MLIVPRRRGSLLLYPAYVQDYLDRVTAADVAAGNTQGLERGVTDAFNVALQDLVADTILGISGGVIAQAASKTKALPFMCGARTLSGCLVPVVGPAPTSFNFASGDYNRKTGLAATASASMYLNSNYAASSHSNYLSNTHVAVHRVVTGGLTGALIGSGSVANALLVFSSGSWIFRSFSGGGSVTGGDLLGLAGVSRSNSSNYAYRLGGSNGTITATASANTENVFVFARNQSGAQQFSSVRLDSYSIGEDINLAVLDARLTALTTALAAAIP
jgi:hypothetical protein